MLGARGEPASAVVTDTTSAPTDYTTSTTGTGGELCGAAAMKAARLTLGIGPPGLDPLPADELARRRAFLKAQREQIAARSTLEHGAAN